MTDGTSAGTRPHDLVFLLDVDNTLLDNDRLKADLTDRLLQLLGQEQADRFWEIYEQVRRERDYVDYPATMQRWTEECRDPELGRTLMEMLDDWPFSRYVYPHAFDALDHLKSFGPAVILSDGDPVFQRRKIANSGLAAAVDGNVLVYVHKEQELADVFARFPAQHYVVVDDKPRILAALERECPRDFTTIMVLQGKYARPDQYTPKPDLVVPGIGDLRRFSREEFVQQHPGRVRAS